MSVFGDKMNKIAGGMSKVQRTIPGVRGMFRTFFNTINSWSPLSKDQDACMCDKYKR